MTDDDQAIIDATPFDTSEINYQQWLDDIDGSVKDKSTEELKRTIAGLARRLAFRYAEAVSLNSQVEAFHQLNRNIIEANREFSARSLSTLQRRVGEWRKAAYPDTMQIELQALGVAEESGELAHAVLKFKQGIRGYDRQKTHDEVGDAIGDIIIFAMGVADHLDIDVEEALYKTVQHVINRNITQGSDAGHSTQIPGMDAYEGQARVEVSNDPEDPMPKLFDVHGRPVIIGDIPPYNESKGVEAFDHLPADHPAPITEPKGVDYAGHVPADITENPKYFGKITPLIPEERLPDVLTPAEQAIARQAVAEATKNTHIPGRPPHRGTDASRNTPTHGTITGRIPRDDQNDPFFDEDDH